MNKLIVWSVSVFFLVTNFDWFLNLVFNIYESLMFVFNNYGNDYKVLAIFAFFIYVIIILPRIGD